MGCELGTKAGDLCALKTSPATKRTVCRDVLAAVIQLYTEGFCDVSPHSDLLLSCYLQSFSTLIYFLNKKYWQVNVNCCNKVIYSLLLCFIIDLT